MINNNYNNNTLHYQHAKKLTFPEHSDFQSFPERMKKKELNFRWSIKLFWWKKMMFLSSPTLGFSFSFSFYYYYYYGYYTMIYVENKCYCWIDFDWTLFSFQQEKKEIKIKWNHRPYLSVDQFFFSWLNVRKNDVFLLFERNIY